MTKAQKAKWIKALRSGKYKQGRDYLVSGGKFCCLGVYGVACLGKDPKELSEAAAEAGQDLPKAVGYRVLGYLDLKFAELNDGAPLEGSESVPFEVIAGVIDQWVETDD